MRGRELRVLRDERLDAHHGLARLAAEMEDAGNADARLRLDGIEGEDALEEGAGFIERPLVEAGVGEQEKKRDVVRGNGDGLAERV